MGDQELRELVLAWSLAGHCPSAAELAGLGLTPHDRDHVRVAPRTTS